MGSEEEFRVSVFLSVSFSFSLSLSPPPPHPLSPFLSHPPFTCAVTSYLGATGLDSTRRRQRQRKKNKSKKEVESVPWQTGNGDFSLAFQSLGTVSPRSLGTILPSLGAVWSHLRAGMWSCFSNHATSDRVHRTLPWFPSTTETISEIVDIRTRQAALRRATASSIGLQVRWIRCTGVDGRPLR